VAGALERFEQAARGAGLSLEIRRFPSGTRTAIDAARAIGCDVGQIVKSLVFMADGEPFLALTSGSNLADQFRLAPLLGATANEAREATGFSIGGTPPIGHPRPLVALVDRDLLGYEIVWAAAGTPDTVFAITPERLMAVTGGRMADFKVEG
jgi:prolyl-tRNA editing enzyme YbaK/EbsC (Cys-tRNA(Pro) deacylase)